MKKLILALVVFSASNLTLAQDKETAVTHCQLSTMSAARNSIAISLGVQVAEKSLSSDNVPLIRDIAAYEKLDGLQLQPENQQALKKYCETLVNGLSN